MDTYPSRIMIKLTQEVAQALARKTLTLGEDDPRKVAAESLKQQLIAEGYLRGAAVQEAPDAPSSETVTVPLGGGTR